MIRICVDATAWHNKRGYGRHARSLLTSLVSLDLDNHYTFVVDSTEGLENLPSQVEVYLIQSEQPTALAASSSGHRSLSDMWRMSQALSGSEFDVVLFPTVYSYVPVLSRAKKLVMIHDVIAEKFPQFTLPRRLPRLFWKAKTTLGRWQADAIITVSEFSRGCISDHFGISPERVYVVGEASDSVFRLLAEPKSLLTDTSQLTSLNIPFCNRIITYVGGFGPHKNLEMLVSVFARLASKDEFSDLRLVMVGEYKREVFHSYFSRIRELVEDLRLEDRIMFTGFLPDEDLLVLLNLATVLVLPSLMEGFGLPAVEAAACGCPVIATTESPLPSLLGNGGLYIDPEKPDELLLALEQVLSSEDLRLEMRAAGLKAVSNLTWEKAADQLKAVIQKVAG